MPSFNPLRFIMLMSADNRRPKTLRMTSAADLSISHNSLRRLFLSRTTGAWNVVSMEERCSTALWINSTVHNFFFFIFHFPSSRQEATLMQTCLYSVLFCLSGGTWKNVRLLYSRHALPGLHYAFSYRSSYCFSPLAEETSQSGQKAYLERSHFEEWVPLSACADGRACPAVMQRDVHGLACPPVCRHRWCHLFSSGSTNRLIRLWPAVLNELGTEGQHRADSDSGDGQTFQWHW